MFAGRASRRFYAPDGEADQANECCVGEWSVRISWYHLTDVGQSRFLSPLAADQEARALTLITLDRAARCALRAHVHIVVIRHEGFSDSKIMETKKNCSYCEPVESDATTLSSVSRTKDQTWPFTAVRAHFLHHRLTFLNPNWQTKVLEI